MTTINEKLANLDARFVNVDDALVELGYVLKAIEELSVEKGAMTRSEIQNRVIELNQKGWMPATSKTNDAET